jgi:hypothetical protein
MQASESRSESRSADQIQPGLGVAWEAGVHERGGIVHLCIIRLYRAQVPQIALVSHEHDDNVGVSVVPELLQPSLHVLKGHCNSIHCLQHTARHSSEACFPCRNQCTWHLVNPLMLPSICSAAVSSSESDCNMCSLKLVSKLRHQAQEADGCLQNKYLSRSLQESRGKRSTDMIFVAQQYRINATSSSPCLVMSYTSRAPTAPR